MGAVFLARVTDDHRVEVPKEVLAALGLAEGDALSFEVLGGETVLVRKTAPIDIEFTLFVESTFSEWLSPEDEEAYSSL